MTTALAIVSPLGARARRCGFTLLEVILALAIALGLLAVVLYFYQQASRLRDATLADTARLAAVRLCLDRLAMELRTASTRPGTFHGGPQSLEFVQCDSASPSAWVAGTNTIGVVSRFPVRRVRYVGHATDQNGSIGGIERTEEPLAPSAPAAPADDTDRTDDHATNTDASLAPDLLTGTNANLFSTATNADFAAEATNQDSVTAISTDETSLLIGELRFLRLRYWDGAAWLDSWNASGLPRGVEISLATEPLPPDALPDALPSEVFRRVIALPAALNEVAPTNRASSAADDAFGTDASTEEALP